MSAKNAVVETHDRVIVVRGKDAGDALRSAGRKALWVGTVRGWMLDRRHEADVLALLEAAGYVVRVEAGDRP